VLHGAVHQFKIDHGRLVDGEYFWWLEGVVKQVDDNGGN